MKFRLMEILDNLTQHKIRWICDWVDKAIQGCNWDEAGEPKFGS